VQFEILGTTYSETFGKDMRKVSPSVLTSHVPAMTPLKTATAAATLFPASGHQQRKPLS
jgi:hypothetical protein